MLVYFVLAMFQYEFNSEYILKHSINQHNIAQHNYILQIA